MPDSVVQRKRILVAGSIWPEDEAVLLPALLNLRQEINDLLVILVPHEPTLEHLEDLEQELLGKATFIRFSGLNEYRGEQVVIVDSIGVLLILYACAHVAYIGGSFRQGIHNVLEAAVYGIPVVFGPRHRNSQEPLQLVERGGGFVVNDGDELYRTLKNLLEDDTARATAGTRAAQFVQSNVGATGKFLQHLEPYLFDKKPGTHKQ
jgi:3-deoxy-D-manno-octulosonic-acid transferase